MSPLDATRRLASIDWSTEDSCPGCSRNLWEDRSVNAGHAADCPMLSLPKIVAALEAVDDLAGTLLMVLDNQIRDGWVEEGSPLLDEPRKALERWFALKGEDAA